MKTLLNLIIALIIADCAQAQDTSSNQTLSENQTYHVAPSTNVNVNNSNVSTDTKPHIYRDTRLGSSSPLYNTYKKNDYGAGAITTNPNKSGGGSYTPSSTEANQIPADSSVNNTTENNAVNDNGSGTTTTNKK